MAVVIRRCPAVRKYSHPSSLVQSFRGKPTRYILTTKFRLVLKMIDTGAWVSVSSALSNSTVRSIHGTTYVQRGPVFPPPWRRGGGVVRGDGHCRAIVWLYVVTLLWIGSRRKIQRLTHTSKPSDIMKIHNIQKKHVSQCLNGCGNPAAKPKTILNPCICFRKSTSSVRPLFGSRKGSRGQGTRLVPRGPPPAAPRPPSG